jgi:hypothetical protein
MTEGPAASIEAVLNRHGFVLSHRTEHEATYVRGPELVSVYEEGWTHDQDITASPWSLAAGHGAADLDLLLGGGRPANDNDAWPLRRT